MRKKYKKVQYLTLQDKFRVLFTVHILQDCLEAIDLGKESEFKKILTLIANSLYFTAKTYFKVLEYVDV